MYVAKKDDGKTYVYIRNGKTYVSTLSLKATSSLTLYMPDGTLLTNASVVINGVTLLTDDMGKVYMNGAKGKNASFDIVHNEMYMTTVEVSYGEDARVYLEKCYLLTVTATGFTYSQYFTVTTTIENAQYEGSLSVWLPEGTSVTVTNTGSTVGTVKYYGSYVNLDGTNTKKTSYTFTVTQDHVVTFTKGYSYDSNSGGT